MGFYAALFREEQCCKDSGKELLEALPQLYPAERATLDRALTLKVLSAAGNQIASGKTGN